jgi:hypothetical protein
MATVKLLVGWTVYGAAGDVVEVPDDIATGLGGNVAVIPTEAPKRTRQGVAVLAVDTLAVEAEGESAPGGDPD